MPLDPSIPLSYNPPPVMGPAQMLSLKDLALQTQNLQQQQNEKVQVKAALSQPGGVDQQGLPSLDAIGKITQINPELGFKMHQMREQISLRNFQNLEKKTQVGMQYSIARVAAYDRAIQSGDNPTTALQKANTAYLTSLDQDESSGTLAQVFAPQEINQARSNGTSRSIDMDRAMIMAHGGQIPKGETPLSDIGKLKADFAAGKISEADYKAEVAKKTAPTMQQQIQSIEISPEDKAYWAEVIRKGGNLPPGLARSAAGAKLVSEIMKEVPKGSKAADLLKGQAEFAGAKAGERTLGTRSANIEMAVNEADQFADLALKASKEFPRAGFVPLNKALNLAASSRDPKYSAFVAANTSFINAYARAISPSGVPTVSDKEHAREMINTAQTPQQYEAVIAQLKKEMQAARKSPGVVRESLGRSITGEKEPSDWVDRAMKANPGMSREEIEAEGRKRGKL